MMRFLTPVQLLRLGGAASCLLDGGLTVVHGVRMPQEPLHLAGIALNGVAPAFVRLALELFAFAFISGSFWYTIQEKHMLAPSRRLVALLVAQNLVSLLFNPCNIFMVSAQAGFLLPFRWAAPWIAVPAALQLALTVWSPALMIFIFPPYVQTLAGPELWLAAGGLIAVYHMLTFGFGALGGHAVRQKWELDRRHAELVALQQIEAGAARVAERLSIARGLHDELGHHLTALSLQLQVAVKQTDGAAKKTVESAYLIARTLLSDIRSTVTELNEEQAIDLPKALKTLVLGIHTPRVFLRVGDGVAEVSALQSQALFRAAQESITNALRHAHARRIWVELDGTANSYRLVVRDDGRGAPAFTPGNGLRGMHERVSGVGGRLELGPPPGGEGFQVAVLLPRRIAETPASAHAAA